MTTLLLIGVSARIHHPLGPARDLGGVYTKTLHYLEQSVAHWVISANVLVFMIPAIESEGLIKRSDMRLYHYAEALDGLVLQGGADISPRAYGEEPQKREWAGDETRDRYEIELVRAFAQAGKPVLGICRGAQLINVALGGSLHQDVPAHRTQDYDLHAHEVRLEPESGLARLYGESGPRRVVSIHHQAIKRLAPNLVVEARAGTSQQVQRTPSLISCEVRSLNWNGRPRPARMPSKVSPLPVTAVPRSR